MYFDEMIWAAVQAFTGDLQPTVGGRVPGTPSPAGWLGRKQEGFKLEDEVVPQTVSPGRWMKVYTNGHIPVSAMEEVPGGGYLRPDAAAAYKAMYRAAKADGVTLPPLAGGAAYRTYEAQASAYYHPTNTLPHAVPGTSNHGWGIAVDMAPNEWLLNHADEYGWYRPLDNDPPHWEFNGSGKFDTTTAEKKKPPRSLRPYVGDPTFAIENLVSTDPNAFANGMFAALADEGARKHGKRLPAYVTKGDEGPGGAVKRQLWQGFMDAGRPDLAKMVYTRDFDTWVKAESGWNPSVVSKYYEGHGRNAGLFQFALLDRGWVWGDVDQQNWSYGATAYEQAKLLVKYFHLTPAEIRNYAQQVRSGTYHGWG